jgi:hypothetical protein
MSRPTDPHLFNCPMEGFLGLRRHCLFGPTNVNSRARSLVWSGLVDADAVSSTWFGGQAAKQNTLVLGAEAPRLVDYLGRK